MYQEITTTTGCGSAINIGQAWPDGDYWMPNYLPTVPAYTAYGYITTPTEPTHCIGKAHVFECEHVSACKCGVITRVMPKVKASKGKKR